MLIPIEAYIHPDFTSHYYTNVEQTENTSRLFFMEFDLNYTVHRQFVGKFTPMSFSISYETYYDDSIEPADIEIFERKVKRLMSPYTNEALMVDVDSHFFVHLLKGQDQGYNRKDLYDDIFSQVKIDGKIWYSHDQVPPLTIQEQYVVSYDVGDPRHGPMRDPINVVKHLANRINEIDSSFIVLKGLITDGNHKLRE
jgi:hypothetical protein